MTKLRYNASVRWLSFRHDLGLQLLAFYLLFVGPVLVAALIFDSLASSRVERDVKAADLALARSIALETDALLQNALRTVAELSFQPQVQAGQVADLAPLFANISAARNEIDLVYRLDAEGVMLYHYPEGPGSTVGVDFSFRAHFKNALILREPFMTIGRISPTTELPVVTAYMPIRDEHGAFLGIMGTNLSLRHLSTTLARISSDAGGGLRVSILDDAGQIVADSDPTRLLLDARSEFPIEAQAVLRGETGSQMGSNAAGREWLRSYVPISSVNWSVIVQRPTDIAFASSRAFHYGVLIAIGVFLAGGLAFWLILSRRVIAPLEHLATFSTAMSRRAVVPADRARLARLSTRPDQMGHLFRTVGRAEQDIERRFAELTTLLETSTSVVSTLDLQRVLDTILEQVERLLGVNMCAIVVLDERTAVLRLRAARGLSQEYLHYLSARIVPGETNLPSIRAIHTGQVVQVRDTESDPDFPPWLRERARAEGYRALTAVPLVAPHSPSAALIVFWRAPHECPAEEISLIVNFANHAAMAIENAALFALTDEKLREQTSSLEALVQSLNDGLILESGDGRILYSNRRILELAEVAPDEISAHSAAALRRRLFARAVGPASEESPEPLDGTVQEFSIDHNGRLLDLRLQSFDVTDEGGKLIGRGQLWLDVTGDREIDRMKTALIATVSHELRTPLTVIKGNITSLLANDLQWDAARQRRFLEVASSETDRLSALVTDLLDLSKLQAGMFVVHREPCALAALAARAAVHARPAPGPRLTLSFPPDLPVVLADPPRIEAVFRNLIENAAKYSAPESPIRITGQKSNNCVLVHVSNEGPGIPLEHRERIFDRFYRVDAGLARQAGGAGLGLAICKGFIEAHGGRIWLEPGEERTIFAFTLPL